ncbi:MAG: DUF4440 domain-containing protein [Bacteroidia bacterium]|nr:DUF4440 domain-containing protein [Bacteroidia bacterium]
MNKAIFTLLILISLSSFTRGQSPSAKVRETILTTMQTQTKAWNAGDLDGFMNGYWENDSLKFIGKSGITYGWQATLDRYKKGYPDKATMGQLTFSGIKMEKLSGKAVFVTGQWHLAREGDKEDVGGWYSLLWKKIKGKWVIVADHSS